MKTIHPEPLALESFRPFGQYANLFEPDGDFLGAAPIEFFADILQVELGGDTRPSFGLCRCSPREFVIDVVEHHNRTCELMLPLDQDVLVQLAPPNAADAPDFDRFRVFRVPKGTAIVLRPGVWHHGPFATAKTPANILILLPERTYRNDATTYPFAEEEKIRINA
jgi:ureidoglycolate lyase